VRQLHVLGVSDDGDALLLAPSRDGGKPSHRIALDERLRAAVRGHLTATGDKAESALSPKEIQSRLREGATPEQVAKAAQVPVARVMPYAAPVIAERERIVEQARGAYPQRHRGPAGTAPLGESVDAHLRELAGLKPETVEWSARRRYDGAWIVSVAYSARGGKREAEWLWRPADRTLNPLDAAASRLTADAAPATRRRSRPAARPATSTRTAAPRRAKKAAKSKPATKRTARTAAKPVARKAKAAPAPRSAAKTVKPVRTTARPAPKPAAKAVRRPASAKPVRSAVAKPARVARQGKAAAPVKRLRAVPDVPNTQATEPVAAPAPRRAGGHVPLPSWSDVLLGVAPAAAGGRRRRS
jgi:hypothetical protein